MTAIDEIKFKYNEDKTLDELLKYISKTYEEHYTNSSGAQAIDVFNDFNGPGVTADYCRLNMLKYLFRLGKKDGWNIKDVYKAFHYGVLMIHFKGNADGER